jgi:hypothetical protein
MFKPLPFVDDEFLDAIHARAERTPDGCLVLHPRHERHRPNRVNFERQYFQLTRLIYAENEGEVGLDSHEVVHIAECPHTEGPGKPLCIEPSHLALVTHEEYIRIRSIRQGGTS